MPSYTDLANCLQLTALCLSEKLAKSGVQHSRGLTDDVMALLRAEAPLRNAA